MLRKLQFTLYFGLLFSFSVFAQSGTVTGIVSDAANNEPLIGTSVQLVELNRGDATDTEGRYEISNVPAGTYTLRVNFVGFKTYEEQVEVGSGTVTVDVTLEEDILAFDDVVVTALGFESNERAVTFATQEVEAEKLNVTQDANVKTGLAGKVAGVQIAGQAGSKLGDFGQIRIRGAISLTNELAEPLYVVDGVPVSDPNTIDMNNVANINVLKGPNATALYGQRGESGVVLISTKKADRSGVSVEVTNAVTWDRVAYLPDYQNEYGQGYAGEGEWGVYEYVPGESPTYFQQLDGVNYILQPYADESWGPRFDGRDYAPWYSWFPDSPYYGQTFPYEAAPDNIQNFFDTGVTGKTGVAVNVFTDSYSGRISYSNLSQNGILPFSNLGKHYLTGTFNYDVTEDLNVGASIGYTTQEVNGDVLSDGYGNQTSGSFNSWYGRDIETDKMRELRGLKTPEGYFTSWNWWGPDLYASTAGDNGFKKPTFWFNSYTWMDRYDIFRNTDNLLLNFDVTYQLSNSLELSGSANTTTQNYTREYYLPFDLAFSADQTGNFYNFWVNSFGVYKDETQETNFDANLNYRTNISDWTVDAIVGGNLRFDNYDRFSADMDVANYQSGGLIIPDVYQFSNSAERITPISNNWEKEVYSLFGKASIGFQDMLYIDGSYRHDWSSALPEDNNGYGYPGIGVSFVFSEMLENDLLSYGKIRAGWAQVGNDVDAEAIISSYALSQDPYTNPTTGAGLPLLGTDATYIDPNIKPAINSSFEGGIDLRFIEDRIGLSATYYNETRKDEIIGVSLSATTGASSYLTNAGTSERQGVELSLNGAPVQSRDFLWDITANWALNETIVTALPQGQDTYDVELAPEDANAFSFVFLTHRLNEEWGQLRGAGYLRDEDGNFVLNSNGTYAVEQNKFFGSVLPDYTGGILNTFAFKNLSLTAAIDFQKGGKFFSLSENWGYYSGLLEETVGNNDLGNPKRDPVSEGGGVHVTGVDVDGNPVDMYVEALSYYGQWYANRLAEPFIHDASFVKLREVSLSYNLPERFIGGFLNSATIGVVGRNLWLIAVADDNKHRWDPSEMSQVYGENGQLPGTRSFGFNLRVTF